MPTVHAEDGSRESQDGSTGVLSSPSWLHGWPLENRSSCQKKSPTPLLLQSLSIQQFAILIWKIASVISKCWQLKFSLLGFLLGFISSRLYKQLISDIPAFKNSVREPSVIWFVFTAKRLFFNPFGVVGFDTPASRTNEKSSGRVLEAQSHPSPGCIACPEDGGKLQSKGQNSCIPPSSCTPCQKPVQGWKSYCIWYKIKTSYQTGTTGDLGKTKSKQRKGTPKQ